LKKKNLKRKEILKLKQKKEILKLKNKEAKQQKRINDAREKKKKKKRSQSQGSNIEQNLSLEIQTPNTKKKECLSLQ
jgi:hypothetical protein